MKATSLNSQLFSYLGKATTPFHAVKEICLILQNSGFSCIDEKEEWDIQPGKPYYFIRDGGSVIAFNIGKKNDTSFRILGAHSDSPCLQIKPHADLYEKSYHRVGVEVYGGALLSSWFDRELSIAGRVIFQTKNNEIVTELVDFNKAAAVIPSVALHLDRKANTEKSLNPQTDITPLIGLTGDSQPRLTEQVTEWINTQHGEKVVNEILSFDLFLYDYHKPCYAGMNNDFILSGRLDNLLSSFLAATAAASADRNNSFLFICNNHEEVGSNTSSGAQGNMLLSLFERIYPDNERRYRVLANSFFISIDNAHAIHPNHPEKHDPSHEIFLNQGPVLKINASHKYASTASSNAVFKYLCLEAGVPVQEFVMRNDLQSGSTIGPMTAAKLGLKTVDIGAATLAMHSVREMTGSRDPHLLFLVLQHFFQCDQLPEIQYK